MGLVELFKRVFNDTLLADAFQASTVQLRKKSAISLKVQIGHDGCQTGGKYKSKVYMNIQSDIVEIAFAEKGRESAKLLSHSLIRVARSGQISLPNLASP